MCMKKFDAEKDIFWQTYRVFNLAIFDLGQKKKYVCFRFPNPTYAFGPTLNILLCWKKI